MHVCMTRWNRKVWPIVTWFVAFTALAIVKHLQAKRFWQFWHCFNTMILIFLCGWQLRQNHQSHLIKNDIPCITIGISKWRSIIAIIMFTIYSSSLCIISTNHCSLEELPAYWLSCLSATQACLTSPRREDTRYQDWSITVYVGFV